MGLMTTIARTVVFAVPVSATFFDLIGTVVAVEGISMQVNTYRCLPPPHFDNQISSLPKVVT
jgi:hypothetical protein